METKEFEFRGLVMNGFLMLFVNFAVLVSSIVGIVMSIIELDDDKKAAMVSNLLVVLCGDDSAQPVVNTGTLNH